MTESERDWRISGREYTPLTEEELVAILDDTGHDTPIGNYTPDQVYRCARGLRAARQLITAITAPDSKESGEVKAKVYRTAATHNGDGKPLGTRESLAGCVSMLDAWLPECFPANEQGQVDFARGMMESVADEIRAYLATLPAEQPVKDGAG